MQVNLQSDWAKSMFHGDEDSATQFLGTLDAIFMITYAVGLFISGKLGDQLNMRFVLATGMCVSALAVSAFGLANIAGIHSPVFYGVFWAINGLFQSAGMSLAVR